VGVVVQGRRTVTGTAWLVSLPVESVTVTVAV
jgi:hypothetical protein